MRNETTRAESKARLIYLLRMGLYNTISTTGRKTGSFGWSRILAISLSPSVRPVSPSPSAVVAIRVEVWWSIWQRNTQGTKARLLIIIVDHEDGVVIKVTVLLSLLKTVLLPY